MHQTGTPGGNGGGGGGGGIPKQRCFCEHYNGLILNLTTQYYLLLACLSVGLLYILVQNIIF